MVATVDYSHQKSNNNNNNILLALQCPLRHQREIQYHHLMTKDRKEGWLSGNSSQQKNKLAPNQEICSSLYPAGQF